MTTRASVGRDALIPPHPAAAQTPAGGYGIRPYGRRRMPRPTGKRQPCRAANPCRGRCLHRPADPASPQGPGRDKSRPYKPSEMTRQTGTAVTTRATVGRDALIPPDPHGGAKRLRADMESAPTDDGECRGQPGKPRPRVTTNPCRGRCSHRPADPAAPEGPPGGINPAPTIDGRPAASRETATLPHRKPL